MTDLEVVNIPLEGDFVSLEMGSKTAEGDKVECPIGLSFSCSDGVFKSNSSQVISGSLKFPNWRMQVSPQSTYICMTVADEKASIIIVSFTSCITVLLCCGCDAVTVIVTGVAD